MRRLTGLVIVLLFWSGVAAEAQENTLVWPPGSMFGACSNDRDQAKFWDDLSILPVEFATFKDNRLTASFASPYATNMIYFWLPPDLNLGFMGRNGAWEEELDRNSFLKRIKKEFWLVIYRKIADENVLCEAHQFQNWQSIRATYGNVSKGPETVEGIRYWQALRMRPLYFHEITEKEAHWLLLMPRDTAPENVELVKLENGEVLSKILKTKDGWFVEITDHGIFKISEDSIFHIVETKAPEKRGFFKTLARFALSGTKIRARPVDLAYFMENGKKNFWLSFFNKDEKILSRSIQIP